MSNIRLVLSIVAALVLVSCDVQGVLVLNNKTDKPAYYRVKVKDTILPVGVRPEGDVEIAVGPGEKKVLGQGFGNFFSNAEIKSRVGQYEYMEIVTAYDSVRLTDKDEMYEFFKKRRGNELRRNAVVKFR